MRCISILAYIIPVSYTHLDVYKRQVWDSRYETAPAISVYLPNLHDRINKYPSPPVCFSDLSCWKSYHPTLPKRSFHAPVSYTHLDVYKRQVIHQVLPQNCASSVRKIYSQITLVQLCGITLIWCETVSYTHLDVYKRQGRTLSCTPFSARTPGKSLTISVISRIYSWLTAFHPNISAFF